MPNASMASIGEIYSLPESQTRDLQRCTDQEVISFLKFLKYEASPLKKVKKVISIHGVGGLGKPPLTQGMYLLNQENQETDHGTWSPRKLVSIPNTFQGKSCNSPKFVGTKTTMELKPTDGSKAVLGMTRYNLLTTREDGDGLDLDEDLALCHVYPLEGKNKGTRNRNGKRSRPEYALDPRDGVTTAEVEELERMISGIDSTQYPPLAVDDGGQPLDVQDLLFADPSKSQPSKFWQSFTKIHTKDPKLMYAACNHCDTMLKLTSKRGAASNCGTGSLKRHNDSCRCKPKQEQLPDSSSSVPILSIASQAIVEQFELV